MSTLLVAGLTVAAVRLSAPASTDDELARLFPMEPGTTWVYRETTNGAPGGSAVVRMAGEAVFVSGDRGVPASIVQAAFDDFAGFGPLKSLGYVRRQGSRILSLAVRRPIELQVYTPPLPLMEAPLRPGRGWSWTGTSGTRRERWSTTVVGLETVRVLGRTMTGCVHLKSEITSPDDAASGLETDEEWDCPGVGTVRRRDEVKSLGVLYEEELVQFHAPGVDMVAPGGSPTNQPPPAAPTSWGIGFDPGRSNFVPNAILDSTALAWSDSRRANVEFPPVGGDGVSVLTENDGTVSALDLPRGEIRWSVRLRGPIVAAPAVVGPIVLAADASKTLFALDAASGATRWSVRFPDLVSTAPAVASGVVVVATEDRRVSGLGLRDGRRMWQVRTGALVKAPPAIFGDRVIVGDEGGTVAALALKDGTRTWEAELDSALTAGPVVSDDLVTVADNAGNLSGYAAADGTLRWTRSLGAYTLNDIPPAAGRGEVVLVTVSTTGKGYVSAFDGQDGRELWRRAVPGDVRHAPMILGSTVAVLTEQSRLWTFDLSSGARKADVSFPPVIDSTVDSDSRVALSYVDGALIVTVRTASTAFAWAETTFFALPAPPSTVSGPVSQGVYFSSSVRSIPDVWTAPPVLLDGDVVFPGFKRVLWGVRPDGTARRLAMSDTPILFASAADGVVLSNLGDDLVAVDPVTGAERWRVAVEKFLPGESPAVTGGNAIMPVSGFGVVAVALASGDGRWTAPASGVGTGAPLVLPDGDVVTALGSLSRLDGATGHEEWSIPDVSTFGSMAFSDGTVFVLAYSSSEVSLLAVDADTHAVSWKQPFNPSLLVGPAAGSGFVVAADQMGLVTAFDARSGTPRWSYSMRSAPCGTPIISGDRVVLTERGRPEDIDQREYRAVVLDLATGRFLGSFEPPGSSGAEGDCGATSDGRMLLPGNLLAQLVTVSER